MKRIVTNLLLFLWIFFVPSSLALHYYRELGLVHGVYVDYRIPQISADALLFIGFIIAFALSKTINLRKIFIPSLLATFFFQFSLSLYQFFFQRSLFGYLPFGEVNLTDPTITTGVTFAGNLYRLPYGTTVHPNLLAAFFVITFLIFLTQKSIDRKYKVVLFFCTTLICFLTQSWSAAIALGMGITVYQTAFSKKLLFSMSLAIPILIIFGFRYIPYTQYDILSITRRAQLQEIAAAMIKDHPLTGIGWNNFTRDLERYGFVSSTVRFLQPVHNVFLLLIAELGILGWLTILAFVYLLKHAKSHYFVFIAPLIILGSLDHYLLTLTTGRMLILLVIVALVTGHSPQEKEH